MSGTQRAWLIFSGLSFVLCAALLLVRFSRSAPAAAPAAAAPAFAAAPPIITEQFTLPTKPGAAETKMIGGVPGSADKVTASPPPPPPPIKTSASRPKKRSPAAPSSAHKTGASNSGALATGSRSLQVDDDDLDAPRAPSAPRSASRPAPPPAAPPAARKDRSPEAEA
ncbi:MAG TPA: hypothetical protein PLW65_32865, partial [Pseudomonadota bacterium]|nr:hypothetical protein [Pseudomonadota bacterium]